MKFTLLLLILMLSLSLDGFSQSESKPRLRVSNDDPRWGEVITVTYTAPDTSVYAKTEFQDTVYCAAIVTTSKGERGIVNSMQRRDKSAVYTAELKVPDSAYSIRLEICIPSDRVPDGIMIFTCRMPDGNAPPGAVFNLTENVDSALTADLALYPRHYTAYILAFDNKIMVAQQKSKDIPDSAKREYLQFLLSKLRSKPDTTIGWYFTVAELESRRKDGEQESLKMLSEAVRHTSYDPLFNDPGFWSSFLYPRMVNGIMIQPFVRGRIIAPLVAVYPRSAMAKMWLRRMTGDTDLNAPLFKQVSNTWSTSKDVDLLMEIARVHSQLRSTMSDAETENALLWINRAEDSYVTRSGFLSGENIFGSMGRFGRLAELKVTILTTLGKYDQAITTARGALRTVTRPSDKERLNTALANAYIGVGNYEGAERALAVALGSSSRRTMSGLDTVYDHRKQPGENKEEYIKRIIASFGKIDELPQIADFTYTTLDGKSSSLQKLKGKIVFLDFWFIGCPGCALERTSLDRLAEDFRSDTSVAFLSVALDGEAPLRKYLKKTDPHFPVIANAQAICDKVGVQGFPTHVILNSNGATVTWEMGGSTSSGELLKKRIKELIHK